MQFFRRGTGFLLLAWLMIAIGLFTGLLFDSMWFARFGSLVVLFAVMTEYMLIHREFDTLYRRLDKITAEDNIPDLSPSKWHRKKVWAAHFTVIIGTLIWGFGDLFLPF